MDDCSQIEILRAQNETLRQLLEVTEQQTIKQCELVHAQQRVLEQRAQKTDSANKRLAITNAIHSLILENSSLGIALVRNRHFDWANRRLAELFGIPLEKLQGASTRIIYDSYETYAELGRVAYPVLAQGRPSDHTLYLRRKNGSRFWCRFIGVALNPGALDEGIVWMFEDISERRQAEIERQNMEVQLRQAQKLESVGRLAAGVAHEINTPVQFVSDSVFFLRDAIEDLKGLINRYQEVAQKCPRDLADELTLADQDADVVYLLENAPKAVNRSLEGLNRVATIVRSMKEFAHPDQKEKVAVDLNQAIQSTLTIARNEYKYVAEVETDFGNLPMVVCHVGDINQAVLNIVVNAAHAIGDVVKDSGKKGVIRICTRLENDLAVVCITDTGNGIPPEIRDRVFDPFFTTKEVGRGTGQGLAIARSVVVEKHGGQLYFETEMGKGTTFFLRLPIEGKPHDTMETKPTGATP